MNNESAPKTSQGIVVESYSKSERVMHPTESRGLVFETDRQRNAAFIQKGITKPGRITFEVLRRAAQSVHIARICINVLKEQVTKTKWVIKPTDPQQEGKEDPRIKKLTDLFRHPNKNNETFRTLLDKMLEDLLILDTVSIEKTRYPNGDLAELHFVDSATIRPVFNEFGDQDIEIPVDSEKLGRVDLPVSYVQVQNNSQYGGPESGEIVAAWPKKDFICFHMHPQGSMEGIGYGLSPLEGVLSVVANLLNADNYNGTYFEEGSFPPVIIQILGQVNQRDVESYRQYLQSELMGNFHRPAIMAGGQEAKILNLKDLSNRDMEFMEYMKFLARLLAAAYGLSGQDIGLTDDLNRATAETQKDLSNQKGYSSILHLIKEIFNQEIIWKDFGFDDLEFDWVADDNTDPKDAITMYKTATEAGFMTVNEVRQKLGLQPFEKWADSPMVLTTEGYKSVISEDPEEGAGDESKTTEAPADKSVVGNERNYKDQDEKPDESENSPALDELKKPEASTKKSFLSRFFGKSSNIDANTLESTFKKTPVMFGELITDQQLRNKISQIFQGQMYDNVTMGAFLNEIAYTYNFAQAASIVETHVRENPESYAGIITEKDERGLKYCVYGK